jgi:hypothetical protein
MTDQCLHEEDRKRAFLALVQMQDQGSTVEESRTHVACQFGIATEDVRGIEREGITKEWPPL